MKLQRQKEEFEEEMKTLEKKIQKRNQSTNDVFSTLQFGKKQMSSSPNKNAEDPKKKTSRLRLP